MPMEAKNKNVKEFADKGVFSHILINSICLLYLKKS